MGFGYTRQRNLNPNFRGNEKDVNTTTTITSVAFFGPGQDCWWHTPSSLPGGASGSEKPHCNIGVQKAKRFP